MYWCAADEYNWLQLLASSITWEKKNQNTYLFDQDFEILNKEETVWG